MGGREQLGRRLWEALRAEAAGKDDSEEEAEWRESLAAVAAVAQRRNLFPRDEVGDSSDSGEKEAEAVDG